MADSGSTVRSSSRKRVTRVIEGTIAVTPEKRPARKSVLQQVNYEEEEEDMDTEEQDDTYKPSEVLRAEDEEGGSHVYGFKTPKKSGQMQELAHKSLAAASPKTPQSTTKGKRGRPKKLAAQTPIRLQSRRGRGDDSSESEDSGSSDEDDSDDDGVGTPTKTPTKHRNTTPKKATPSKITPRKRGRPPKVTVEPEAVEAFFEAQSHGTNKTSDRTLAKLKRMDQETLDQVLTGLPVMYERERRQLYKEYRAGFRKWMFLMSQGFNLLLYGLGSKRKLMEDFRENVLKDLTHIVVNGYFPSITVKHVLDSITRDVMNHEGSFHNVIEQCDFIRKHYECGDQEDVFLLIHNIEGPMLRAEKTQAVLSLLAQVRGFHIIASLDHINGSLIWDQNKTSRFNWHWCDVTSYEPYSEETSFENSLLIQHTGALALSSLTHVMRSLTPNAKGIFKLLVEYQLEGKDSQIYQGMAFPDLYHRCREAFLVNSDLTLRSQLTEFLDHKLVKSKKLDGVEYLSIPLDSSTLKEFLQQEEN